MQFYDRKKFFDTIRTTLPPTRVLSTSQVAGFEVLLKEGESRNVNTEWIAYVLATVWHETGATMEPVRETFAATDAEAIANLNRMYGSIKTGASRYWTDGYFGRGYIQLTWKTNYAVMGRWLGVALIGNPSVALDPTIASKIAYEGMLRGMFTAKKLSDYIDTTVPSSSNEEFLEFVHARRIINGTDRATVIANYAMTIRRALSASEQATPVVPPVPKPEPVTDPVQPSVRPVPLPPAPDVNKPLAKSTTFWAALAVPALAVLHAFQTQNNIVQGGIILASVAVAFWIINKRIQGNAPVKK